MDLSSPKGGSVNEGVDPCWASMSYTSVDHLVALVLQHGPGALLVKADVKEAVPVNTIC